MKEDEIENTSVDYTFSIAEIKLLAKFLRKNQETLPEGLEKFHKVVEDTIYDLLSIEEVRQFYS